MFLGGHEKKVQFLKKKYVTPITRRKRVYIRDFLGLELY
jgi:hypothetical protein